MHLGFSLFIYPYFLPFFNLPTSNIKYYVISQTHYTKLLQSLLIDFFFSNSPPVATCHTCFTIHLRSMSPQTIPHLPLWLHLHLMSIVLSTAPYYICLCSQASRDLLISMRNRTWRSDILLVTSDFTIFLLVTVNISLVLK